MRHQKVSIDSGSRGHDHRDMHSTHPGVLCRYVDYLRTSSALCR